MLPVPGPKSPESVSLLHSLTSHSLSASKFCGPFSVQAQDPIASQYPSASTGPAILITGMLAAASGASVLTPTLIGVYSQHSSQSDSVKI